MIYKNRLLIISNELAGIDNILNGEEELSEDETITYTTLFPDGKEMDIKVCGCEASEGGAWTEAVLFNENGSELCCTECMESITGEWELEYDGNSYICVVEEGV